MPEAPATNVLGLSRPELEELAVACGEQRYRGRQLYHGLYGRALGEFESFTDLDRTFREHLASEYEIVYPRVVSQMPSKDRSIRYLLGLAGCAGLGLLGAGVAFAGLDAAAPANDTGLGRVHAGPTC